MLELDLSKAQDITVFDHHDDLRQTLWEINRSLAHTPGLTRDQCLEYRAQRKDIKLAILTLEAHMAFQNDWDHVDLDQVSDSLEFDHGLNCYCTYCTQ